MPYKLSLENGQTLAIGDHVTLSAEAQIKGIGPAGHSVQLYEMHPDDDHVVGLYSDTQLAGWGDLDGEVGDNHGWYVNVQDLIWLLEWNQGKAKIINSNFEFNGVQLKGSECKFLSSIQNTKDKLVFVELNEDVGGCSADGLGKRGHCVAVPSKIIKDVSKKKSNST